MAPQHQRLSAEGQGSPYLSQRTWPLLTFVSRWKLPRTSRKTDGSSDSGAVIGSVPTVVYGPSKRGSGMSSDSNKNKYCQSARAMATDATTSTDPACGGGGRWGTAEKHGVMVQIKPKSRIPSSCRPVKPRCLRRAPDMTSGCKHQSASDEHGLLVIRSRTHHTVCRQVVAYVELTNTKMVKMMSKLPHRCLMRPNLAGTAVRCSTCSNKINKIQASTDFKKAESECQHTISARLR